MNAPAASFRLTGFHVLAMICAFFGLVIGADVWFAVLAYKSFSGQVAENPYEAGLLYNRRLEQRRAEAALGWTAEAKVADGALVMWFRDAAGSPVDGLTVAASLVRPATESGRVDLVLERSAPGVYRAKAPRLSGGWDIRGVATSRSGDSFEIETRVVLP